MHELAIMEDVLQVVLSHAKEQKAVKVNKINLTAGALSGVIPRWAQLFFSMISKDTIAQDAELCFHEEPGRIVCRACERQTEFGAADMRFACGHCGSEEITLVSGKEFFIDSIEAVVPGHPPGDGKPE